MPRGRYVIKVYVDQDQRLARDWKAALAEKDFVGQAEVESTWPEGYVPHWPFGTTHKEFAETLGIPFEASRGYKEAMYPEYLPKLRKMMAEMPAATAAAKPATK